MIHNRKERNKVTNITESRRKIIMDRETRLAEALRRNLKRRKMLGKELKKPAK